MGLFGFGKKKTSDEIRIEKLKELSVWILKYHQESPQYNNNKEHAFEFLNNSNNVKISFQDGELILQENPAQNLNKIYRLDKDKENHFVTSIFNYLFQIYHAHSGNCGKKLSHDEDYTDLFQAMLWTRTKLIDSNQLSYFHSRIKNLKISRASPPSKTVNNILNSIRSELVSNSCFVQEGELWNYASFWNDVSHGDDSNPLTGETYSTYSDSNLSSNNNSHFQIFLDAIQTEFIPEPVFDEKELQSQLSVFLRAKFPNNKIEREVRIPSGGDIDIVIDNTFAIELKIPKDRTTLRNLIAQIDEYQEYYPNIAVLLLDVSLPNIGKHLDEYRQKYLEKYNAETIVIQGRLRG